MTKNYEQNIIVLSSSIINIKHMYWYLLLYSLIIFDYTQQYSGTTTDSFVQDRSSQCSGMRWHWGLNSSLLHAMHVLQKFWILCSWLTPSSARRESLLAGFGRTLSSAGDGTQVSSVQGKKPDPMHYCSGPWPMAYFGCSVVFGAFTSLGLGS